MNDLEAIPREDAEIASRIRTGDAAAEEQLALRFQPGLTAIARIRAGRDRAPDLVQETLAVALTNLRRGEWKAEGTLAAYLAGILRHLIARGCGRPSIPEGALSLRQASEAIPDPHTAMEREEASDLVRQVLARLSPRHREVLLLHYLEEKSIEEIAVGLSVPRGTVLSRLHHGRRKMAQILNRLRGGPHSSSKEAFHTR